MHTLKPNGSYGSVSKLALAVSTAILITGCQPEKLKNTITPPTDTTPVEYKQDSRTRLHTIQGSGAASPMVGESVEVSAIVTGTTNNGFFIQEPSVRYDNDANTSEGLFVYKTDATVNKGDFVVITGSVKEQFNNTQLDASTVTVVSSGHELPAGVRVPVDYAEFDFEAIEGMIARIENAVVADNYNLTRYGELRIAPDMLDIASEVAVPLSEEFNDIKAQNNSYQLLVEDNTSAQNVDGLSFIDNFTYSNTVRLGDSITAEGPINYSFSKYRINVDDPAQVTVTSTPREETFTMTAGDISIASFNVLNYFNGIPEFEETTPGTNIAINGDFAQFSAGLPNNWTRNDSQNSNFSLAQVTEIDSTYSLEVETFVSDNKIDLRQSIAVEAGKTYTVSVDVYHPSVEEESNTSTTLKARIYAGNYTNVYSNPSIVDQWQTISYDYVAASTTNVDFGFRIGYPVGTWVNGEKVLLANFRVTEPGVAGDYIGQDFAIGDNGRGVRSAEAFAIQQGRIVKALAEINADVVGLLEIENDGFDQYSAIQALVDALNTELGDTEGTYTFVDPGTETIGTDAITTGLIYKTDKLDVASTHIIEMPVQDSPSGKAQMRNALVAAFNYNGGTDMFAVAVNHFKSKGSECFEDKNTPTAQDEAQGNCNAFRVSGALALADRLEELALPEKVFIMGDLNAYSKEDPISVLTTIPAGLTYSIMPGQYTPQYDTYTNAGASTITEGRGYTNLGHEYDEGAFSYTFNGEAGNLDHILASPEVITSNAIVDVKHWNINSIEPGGLRATSSFFNFYDSEYHQANYYDADKPFISSDHDPVVVTLDLSETPMVISAP